MAMAFASRRRASALLWIALMGLLHRLRAVQCWSATRARRISTLPLSLVPKYGDSPRHHASDVMTSSWFTTSSRSLSSSSLSVASDVSQQEEEIIKVPKKFVPYPFQYRQELTARVASLTNLGMGVCRVSLDDDESVGLATPNIAEEDEQAHAETPSESSTDSTSSKEDSSNSREWVIFVPNVIPGEFVKLRVYRNYKTYSDADLVEVLESSSDRVEPVCPLSTTCGGCQYQHMTIKAQRDWKTNHVLDVLQRIGQFQNNLPVVSPTVGTDHVWHYRSKITPHYQAPRKLSYENNNSYEIDKIGFKVKSSRQLIDVPYCYIATEAINEKLTEIRQEIHDKARTGQLKRPKRGATLLLRDVDEGVVTDHNTYVTTTVSNLSFRFMAGNFFQNNPYMLPVMVDHVVAAATKHPAAAQHDKQLMTHLIDCYCGSGLFCLSCASSFDVCVGIELNDKAVDEARANAELNKIENCVFVAASAEAIFESARDEEESLPHDVQDFPRDQTVVVIDPPRKGCSEEFLDQVMHYGPQRVVYMSCDPATQARDCKRLVDSGLFAITSVQPFDLFPQTRHIESLVVLERTK